MDTPLFVYRQGEINDDLLIAQMWSQMAADGDLHRVLSAGSRSLSGIYRVLAPPALCLLRMRPAAEGGIWFATWFTPFLDGLAFGVWIKREHRATRRALATLIEAWDLALARAPFLVGVTKQPQHLDQERRLGFVVLEPPIENAYDGERTWTIVLARDAFVTATQRFRRATAADVAATNGVVRV